MTIVRVGLGETKKFGDGYDAIFSKKKRAVAKKSSVARTKKQPKAKKK